MSRRDSKIVCVLAVAFYGVLATLTNIIDYKVNFSAVAATMTMKDIFAGSSLGIRAINYPLFHHLAFIFIIFCEGLGAVVTLMGTFKLIKNRSNDALIFNQEKNWAIAGLTITFLTWQVLFMTIAGEWFGIWMASTSLAGTVRNAFQIFMMALGVLIYLNMDDK
ncbi:MAG: hypothetical protein BGO90_04245 [Legionella sp. 40-6]|nr:DUF2165 domain-containing protein [Legionella sp.]OJY44191.1 MAG: hypothetical protein BGO90_04245 [Legionella sp. 40-6]